MKEAGVPTHIGDMKPKLSPWQQPNKRDTIKFYMA